MNEKKTMPNTRLLVQTGNVNYFLFVAGVVLLVFFWPLAVLLIILGFALPFSKTIYCGQCSGKLDGPDTVCKHCKASLDSSVTVSEKEFKERTK